MNEEASNSGPVIATNTDDEAVAIMVHGTYAAQEEDSGTNWWQTGSTVAQRIEKLLPGLVRAAKEKEIFHWSGDNSDRARSKAAAKLVRHLRQLEAQGQSYHLVGHSHGGSVIWNALKMTVLTKRPLQGLRSWTTVGTPFMHHRSPGALNIKNLLGLIVGLLLLVPAMAAPKQLLKIAYNVAVDNRTAIVLQPDHSVIYSRVVRSPVLTLVDFFGIPVDQRPDGIHVGSYDAIGSMPLAKYYFATPEGLFLLVLLCALSYLFIHFAVLCISPAIESYRIRIEQRLHRLAFDSYGSCWLGLWSPDDEAINGLRATLDITVSFVGKMHPREVVYLTDILALLWRPYFWLIGPIYNRFVRPAVDEKVRTLVIRSAQGSDRPTATLVDVTPVPIANPTFSAPSLPALLNVKLLAFSNRHAHDLVPKLRRLMAQSTFTGFESFGKNLSGNELVHTSYFEQDEVIKLIAANMAWSTEAQRAIVLQSMSPWLGRWISGVKEGINDKPIDHAPDELGKVA